MQNTSVIHKILIASILIPLSLGLMRSMIHSPAICVAVGIAAGIALIYRIREHQKIRTDEPIQTSGKAAASVFIEKIDQTLDHLHHRFPYLSPVWDRLSSESERRAIGAFHFKILGMSMRDAAVITDEIQTKAFPHHRSIVIPLERFETLDHLEAELLRCAVDHGETTLVLAATCALPFELETFIGELFEHRSFRITNPTSGDYRRKVSLESNLLVLLEVANDSSDALLPSSHLFHGEFKSPSRLELAEIILASLYDEALRDGFTIDYVAPEWLEELLPSSRAISLGSAIRQAQEEYRKYRELSRKAGMCHLTLTATPKQKQAA